MADQKPIEIRAKRHKILSDFTAEVKSGFLEETFKVRGHDWLLRTPTEDESVWADKFIQSNTPISFVSSRRAPKLAVSIKSIDGVPVSDLFSFQDDMGDDLRKVLTDDKDQRRYWLYGQMMTYLLDSVPPPVIEELYEKYESLTTRQRDALKEAGKQGPN